LPAGGQTSLARIQRLPPNQTKKQTTHPDVTMTEATKPASKRIKSMASMRDAE